jgi:ankyrin repeat protein
MSQMDFSDAELLLKGEDPDATERLNPDVCYDSGGITAMHMAATNDDVEGVQLLLKYGADKDFRSEDGQTALDMAKAEGSKQVVALLSAESEE